MEKFDERKKSFEKKFAHDEELKFKVASRRNKYLGQWASKKLGYDENKEKEYIQSVIKADFQEAGDEDVFRKIQADLKGHNISDEDIRNKMRIICCRFGDKFTQWHVDNLKHMIDNYSNLKYDKFEVITENRYDDEKGVLNKLNIENIIGICNSFNIPVYVDPKKENFFQYKIDC